MNELFLAKRLEFLIVCKLTFNEIWLLFQDELAELLAAQVVHFLFHEASDNAFISVEAVASDSLLSAYDFDEHGYAPARVGELQRVAQEVEKNLNASSFVAFD